MLDGCGEGIDNVFRPITIRYIRDVEVSKDRYDIFNEQIFFITVFCNREFGCTDVFSHNRNGYSKKSMVRRKLPIVVDQVTVEFRKAAL